MIIRPALPEDVPRLETLIAASARALSIGFYTPEQTEAAITHVFGVDSELVEDGSYLVVEIDGALAGCGGWSRRATLFGSDRYGARASGFVDPALSPARIRAFFIAPEFARRGVGRALLHACEQAAREAGFTRAELMATLPGVPFYAALGFVAGEGLVQDHDGVELRFVAMHKSIAHYQETDPLAGDPVRT